jgi:hypothetical protein
VIRIKGASFGLRSLLFAGLLPATLFPATTVFAEKPGKVVEYGIYSKNNKLLKKTATIPAGGAVRFGFCFEADVQFFDDDRYMLVESLSHPVLDGQQGGENNGYSVPRMFKIRDGTAYGCSGYRARDASDLHPGIWRFVISDGPDELVVQEFEIK